MRVLVLILTLLSNVAFAGIYEVEVCKVQSQTNDTGFLYPCDKSWVSKNNCGGSWVVWDMSEGQGKAMYSTALAAMLFNKTITLRVSGVDGECIKSYDITSMIRINK